MFLLLLLGAVHVSMYQALNNFVCTFLPYLVYFHLMDYTFRFGCRVSQSLVPWSMVQSLRHLIPFGVECVFHSASFHIAWMHREPRTRTFLLAQIKCIFAVVEKLNCIRRSYIGYYPIKPLAKALDLYRFMHKVHHAKMVKMRHRINTIRFSFSFFLWTSDCVCVCLCARRETNHMAKSFYHEMDYDLDFHLLFALFGLDLCS